MKLYLGTCYHKDGSIMKPDYKTKLGDIPELTELLTIIINTNSNKIISTEKPTINS